MVNEESLTNLPDLETRARRLSAMMPGLVLSARQIAHTLVHGSHGRKRAGPGETFWQFRPYSNSEPAQRIDWRRSASSDQLYVREKEWDTAHTFWLWIDITPSMWYQSPLGMMSKAERACLIGLAVAEILVRSGERVGVIGLKRPSMGRDIVAHIAERLLYGIRNEYGQTPLPAAEEIRRFSEVILISDFLADENELFPRLNQIGGHQVGGTLVHVIDPAEESFPFQGRVQFEDMTADERLMVENAVDMQAAYRGAFAARKNKLLTSARQLNWGHIIHHTDHSARSGLLHLYGYLSTHYFTTGAMVHEVKSGDAASGQEAVLGGGDLS